MRAKIRALEPNLFTAPEQIVERSVTLARASRGQRISVAGPSSLDAMVSLCRAGFNHVECARQATCACADEASDVLLVVGLMPPAELAAVLARTCRLLRDGGVLAVQLQSAGDDAAVCAALTAAGMRESCTVFDLSPGCLVAHTVERVAAREGRRTA
jgi:hypothetical protein